MATPNDTPAPTKPLMAGCQQEPCSAVLALKRLQARFRHLYKTAGERWQEAEKRGDLAAMQENACEKSAYVQAAMEVTNEIDLLNSDSANRQFT